MVDSSQEVRPESSGFNQGKWGMRKNEMKAVGFRAGVSALFALSYVHSLEKHILSKFLALKQGGIPARPLLYRPLNHTASLTHTYTHRVMLP